MFNSLIIGNGEVGQALFRVLRPVYNVYIQDMDINECPVDIDILHICFPYSKSFISDVQFYIDHYRPRYTIIHSTVPIGTSKQCQTFHSPVRGMHPDMERGIRFFVKYLAPKDRKLKKYFEEAGIKIKFAKTTEDTEAMKLWDTTQYGLSIVAEKLINKFCKENKLDFDLIYTDANKTYNEGYTKLKLTNVIRPVLKHIEGPIGGHCVMENCDLLKSEITNFIKKLNKTF